ncbi:nucleotide-binding universal stress UspA family protein [Clavibacter michiganensis]|uniref:universal stress protein n=1 Tax=Clavibacter michiganensis TaxID=28447 RepID=UPI001AE5287A|nr:universal stress protein [Clavibacter michiganensis]MBP2458391.1 nucleotide-binding universal stress UspA family protein [Clavibacter michiganensis]MDQ0410962.1 nucleotide-binding universal stress UspA family protein [Clavibacter michiganensis]
MDDTSHRGAAWSDRNRGPFDARRIVVGYDGSPVAHDALERAVDIACVEGATLDVIHAWSYPMAYEAYPLADWSPHEDARRRLADGLHRLFGVHVPAWVHPHALEGLPARILIDASSDAGLLVVGSRGHGGFVGLLLGAVSATCAEHARCPVLVIHRPGRGREARDGPGPSSRVDAPTTP